MCMFVETPRFPFRPAFDLATAQVALKDFEENTHSKLLSVEFFTKRHENNIGHR